MIEFILGVLKGIWKAIVIIGVVVAILMGFLTWKGLDARSQAGREAARHEQTMKELKIRKGRRQTSYLVKFDKDIPNRFKYNTLLSESVWSFLDYYGLDIPSQDLESYVGEGGDYIILKDENRGNYFVLSYKTGECLGYLTRNVVEPKYHKGELEAIYDVNTLAVGYVTSNIGTVKSDSPFWNGVPDK